MNRITLLEKAALLTTGAAAAFKALLWSLGTTIDSTDPAIGVLRVIFAALSFVAFDLVIGAVVFRGWSRSGAVALAVAAAVSAVIALDVASNWHTPALHAAPAITLAAFGVHLMLSRRADVAVPAASLAPTAKEAAVPAVGAAQATAAVQVNVAAIAPLPRTIPAYIAARAAELPEATPAQLAAELGTSADTVRRALALAAAATTEQESSHE